MNDSYDKILRFTGSFKTLKEKGYKFQKLYASNYKCYHKSELKSGTSFWIWVGNGGYIELNDFYGHTNAIIELMKTIDWESVVVRKTPLTPDYKRVFIRFNHNHPENGYMLSDISLDMETHTYARNNGINFIDDKNVDAYDKAYEIAYNKVRELHDREVYVSDKMVEEILSELELIQTK